MAEPGLSISADEDKYTVGDVARFTVTVQFDGPSPADPWMTPSFSVLVDGEPQGTDTYPDYPLHEETGDETRSEGWFVVPLHRGRWGTFRAEALVWEPERYEYGRCHVDIEVENRD